MLGASEQCERCGEPLQANQLSCATCGAAVQNLSLADSAQDYVFGAEPEPSSMFLMPEGLTGSDPDRRNRRGSQDRLLLWIAVGLAAVSLFGGIAYYLYYLQVGNPVTALLPRDTVAYIRVGPPKRLQQAFETLDQWTHTRPIRDQLHQHESRLIESLLLDVGVNTTALNTLKQDLSELHIAVLPGEEDPVDQPYDLLFFLEFEQKEAHQKHFERLLPYYGHAGDERGTPFYIRHIGTTTLTLTQFEPYILVGWGSDAAVRQVLRNREEGPSNTLDDATGFRMAFRAHAHETDLWAYVRYDQLASVLLDQVLPPFLGGRRWDALRPYLSVLHATDVEGTGFAINIRGGVDGGRFGFYSRQFDGFEELAQPASPHQKQTLSAIPRNAVLTIATSFEEPAEALPLWSAPASQILQMAGVLEGLGTNFNRAQAETSTYLTDDVFPNISRELTLALVPRNDGSRTWLIAARVKNTRRALSVLERLLLPAFRGIAGPNESIHFREGTELRQIERHTTAPDSENSPPKQSLACWTDIGSLILLSDGCDIVRAAVDAEINENGLIQEETVQRALGQVPEGSAVLVLAQLRTLLKDLSARPLLSELIGPDFMAAATVSVFSDRLEIDANLSGISLGFLYATTLLDGDTFLTEESTPCRRLVERVCGDTPDSERCQTWTAKVAGSSSQACRTSLRTMAAMDARAR